MGGAPLRLEPTPRRGTWLALWSQGEGDDDDVAGGGQRRVAPGPDGQVRAYLRAQPAARCATMLDVPTRRYRLSRFEYERAVDAGVFEPDARLELVDGALLAMARETPRHATGTNLAASHLRRAFKFWLPRADTAPDRDRRPTETLQHDRTVKQRLYARCRIPEYWVLALNVAQLGVYRDPAEDGYRTVTTHGAGDTVAPLARPDAQVGVADLLP